MTSVVGDVPPDDFIASYTASSQISSSSSLPSWLGVRYGRSRKCVSSKAALLILLWTFVVVFLRGMLNPDLILTTFPDTIVMPFVYGNAVIFTCFFPLAGFCADTRCGRYKTVVTSLCILVPVAPLLGVGLILMIMTQHASLVWLLVGVTILGSVGLVGFSANVVQFGMDQLHDSPGEDRTLFIHWYVWTYNASLLADQLAQKLAWTFPYNITSHAYYNKIGYCLLESIFLSVSVVLPITLCLARRRRGWFLIEPGQYNPYKLVYGVTKFSRQHKTPVLRSAFTYCEDEVPRGLDLGKEKYGGPFTTEQVEDVKAFYGILKVLLSFGVVFFIDFAASSVLPLFALHTAPYHISPYHISPYHNMTYDGPLIGKIVLNNGLLSPLLVAICIPLYLCLLRPFISHYVPGMLKRMGLGMIFVLLSLLATFSMDTAAHRGDQRNSLYCMFKEGSDIEHPTQSSTFLVFPLTLSALSHILIYTSVFEFICSQSPHSMKGLLVGVLYAIRGLYQLVAALLTLPFTFADTSHLSCGFYFYLVNIVIGLVAVLVYVWVAKRYRYRVRDELCNVHQYAEDYYSNPRRETFYDYSGEHTYDAL